MKKHLLICLLAVINIVTAATTAVAQIQFTVDGIVYETPNSYTYNVTVVGLATGNTATEITIPETIKNGNSTYNVTSIADDAFKGSSLTSVTLSPYINSIGANAFANITNLKLTLQGYNPPTLGNDYVFDNSNVVFIFDYAAGPSAYNGWLKYCPSYEYEGKTYYCRGKYSYAVDDATSTATVIKWIGGDYNYTATVTEKTPEINGKNYSITKIADYAFYGANIPAVTIDAAITEIGNEAFASSSIKTVSFTNSSTLKTIGYKAFYQSALTSFFMPMSVTEIGESAFGSCSSLKNFTISTSSLLNKISKEAFYGSGLTSINIPASVTEIEEYAFASCNDLATLTFANGSSLATIGHHAFSECDLSGAKVLLPNSVTSIGEHAFEHTKLSKGIQLPGSLKEISDNMFWYSQLPSISIPASVSKIGASAFQSCGQLETVSLASKGKLSEIGSYAFSESGLTSVTIPATVVKIEEHAFSYCGSLATVEFAEGGKLKELENGVFVSNTALTAITIPASLTKIPEYTFDWCSNLSTVTFAPGSKLSCIEKNAFEGCQISEIELPASVTYIGRYAFDVQNVNGVTSFTLTLNSATAPKLGDVATDVFDADIPEANRILEFGEGINADGCVTGYDDFKSYFTKSTVNSFAIDQTIFEDEDVNLKFEKEYDHDAEFPLDGITTKFVTSDKKFDLTITKALAVDGSNHGDYEAGEAKPIMLYYDLTPREGNTCPASTGNNIVPTNITGKITKKNITTDDIEAQLRKSIYLEDDGNGGNDVYAKAGYWSTDGNHTTEPRNLNEKCQVHVMSGFGNDSIVFHNAEVSYSKTRGNPGGIINMSYDKSQGYGTDGINYDLTSVEDEMTDNDGKLTFRAGAVGSINQTIKAGPGAKMIIADLDGTPSVTCEAYDIYSNLEPKISIVYEDGKNFLYIDPELEVSYDKNYTVTIKQNGDEIGTINLTVKDIQVITETSDKEPVDIAGFNDTEEWMYFDGTTVKFSYDKDNIDNYLGDLASITITGTAQDNTPINVTNKDGESSAQYTFNLGNGKNEHPYTLTVVVEDTEGNQSVMTKTYEVSKPYFTAEAIFEGDEQKYEYGFFKLQDALNSDMYKNAEDKYPTSVTVTQKKEYVYVDDKSSPDVTIYLTNARFTLDLQTLSLAGNMTWYVYTDAFINNYKSTDDEGFPFVINVKSFGSKNGTLTINDGTFNGLTLNVEKADGVQATIKGGTFSNGQSFEYGIVCNGQGTVNIEGGTFSSTNTSAVVVDNGTLNISGGDFTGNTYALNIQTANAVSVSGGKFSGETAAIHNGASLTSVIASGYFARDEKDEDQTMYTEAYNDDLNLAKGSGTEAALNEITIKKAPEPYAVLTTDAESGKKTLTFYYDGNSPESTESTPVFEIKSYPWGWTSSAATIDAVVIDDSFKNFKPQSCNSWFCNFKKITSLDLTNLNTSSVKNMQYMFESCTALEDIKIGNEFSTSNVTSMWRMFNDCKSLTSESLNKILTATKKDAEGHIVTDGEDNPVYLFDTKNVTDMYFLFAGCKSLTTIDVSHLNTSKANRLTCMFQDCSGLGTGEGNEDYVLDISNFSTAAIDDNDDEGRYGLTGMFNGCTNLKNINFGTTFASEGNFKRLSDMFYNCEKLEKVDLSHFKMDNVIGISNMFAGCKSLKKIDLTCFGNSTKNFIDVDGVFNNCENLTTVLVNADWTFSNYESTNTVVQSVKMCTNLIGEKGTMTPEYNTENASYFKKDYLRIDDPANGRPGYLSTKIVVIYDLNGGTWPSTAVHPDELTGSETSDIVIGTPTKDGYEFTGWTGTDLDDVSTSVTIGKDDTYNHKYTAHWQLSKTVTAGIGASFAISGIDEEGLEFSPTNPEGANGTVACAYNTSTKKYTLTTNDKVKDGEIYTLKTSDEKSIITVTIKDYTPTVLTKTDWQKSIVISSANESATSDFNDEGRPIYDVEVSVGTQALTADANGKFTIPEGEALSVTYIIVSKNTSTDVFHSVTKTVNVDGTAPIAPSLYAGEDPVTIPANNTLDYFLGTTLYLQDDGNDLSGIKGIYYKLYSDTEPDAYSTYNATKGLLLDNIGTYTLKYYCEDNAGNSSTETTLTVKVNEALTIALPEGWTAYRADDESLSTPLTYAAQGTQIVIVAPKDSKPIDHITIYNTPTSIVITAEDPYLVVNNALSLDSGETLTLSCKLYPEITYADEYKKVTWTSSDENIVTVDENGNVTAKAVGFATITAKTDNDKTATITVTVNAI